MNLSKINQLLTSNALEELYPQPYNVLCHWDDKKISMDENDHTRMLLSLLKYKRPFSQKYLMPILYSFVKTLGINVDLTGVSASHIRFSPVFEKNGTKSFPDGFICKDKNFAIIIENKICDATDQPQQIKRYIRAAVNQGVHLKNVWVVYLTKDGHMPSITSYNLAATDFDTYNIDDRLLCVSYRDELLPWMKNEVLPMVYYSEHLLACSLEVYLNYMETAVFFTDTLSRARGELQKAKIYKELDIDETNPVTMYQGLVECKKKLAETEAGDKELLDSFLDDCIKEIMKPVIDEFERITKMIFLKETGVQVDVMYGFNREWVKLCPKGWDPAIHYEWCAMDAYRFMTATEFPLMIHIEGSALKPKKVAFENAHQGEFDHQVRKLLKSSTHTSGFLIKFTDMIPNLIANDKLEKELTTAYGEILKYYSELTKL